MLAPSASLNSTGQGGDLSKLHAQFVERPRDLSRLTVASAARRFSMRVRSTPATLLLRIPLEQDRDRQAAIFRQAMTALAQATTSLGPPALDGVDRLALESATHIALERGLTDDLDFMAAGPAAVALYELSSAVPAGQVKRDLRRRVFSLLYKGDAGTFIPVATRIALGAAGPLSTPTLQARVALCLELPLGSSVNVAPLALALTTRSATHAQWIDGPSTRALPARRMAAQLYEHAAREAVFRFQLGDPQPRDLLLSPRWKVAFSRLLADREPLVWQHAAVARGLLASVHPEVREQVEQSLDPGLTITEWRRGAVSLVASTVLGDEEAHRSVLSVLDGPVAEQDRGLAATMVAGLARVIEMEPDRAEDIADHLAATRRPAVAIAMAELLSRTRDQDFGVAARAILRDCLAEAGKNQSKIERSLSSRALRMLSRGFEDEPDLIARVNEALVAFEEHDAPAAYAVAQEAIREAHEIAAFIEASDPILEHGAEATIASLVEIDGGALETATLSNLLLLGRAPGDPAGTVEQFERLQNRTGRWVLDGIEKAGRAAWSRDGAMADQRRLRVLLHLVDAGAAEGGDSDSRPLVARLQRSICVLLERLSEGPDAVVHRVLCAALARSFDAAVREEVMQASDLLLMVATRLSDNYSVRIIAEASTTDDVAGPLTALADFISPDLLDPHEAESSSAFRLDPAMASSAEVGEALRRIGRLMSLSQGLVGGGGYHAEALRRVFFRLGRALERIAIARGQVELVEPRDSGAPVLEELALACEELLRMVRCAEKRVLGQSRDAGEEEEHLDEDGLYEIVERGVESERPPAFDQLAEAVESMVRGLPEPVANAIEQVAFRIESLPQTCASDGFAMPLAQRRAVLPDWLLPRRAIGSFHVVRPLGAGGVSSVFLARRLEERNNAKAEAFALKVPEYDPSTARSMSEKDFFQMFRDEAGALLSLPSHENLARFVTFDLSARPKPILVMELIHGTPLDRLIRSRALSMPRVVAQLDGILAGLEAMHAVDVGHLDIKPSNVILRDSKAPVLVDFGLSGRTLRPGCGTIEYTAPEVLGVVPEDCTPSPIATDIYAFGCLVFEMLTGTLLFDGPDEMAIVSQHVNHDGWLTQLQKMAQLPRLDPLANLIGSCLRHDGRHRPTAAQLRNDLTPCLLPLTDISWPLTIPEHLSAS